MAWFWQVFYAALAGAVTIISWRTPIGVLGLVLLGTSIASGFGYFGSDLGTQLIVELVCEVAIVLHARIAFAAGATYSARFIIALAVLDVAVVSVTAPYGETHFSRVFFGFATNAIFFLQCVGVAAPGVRDAYLGWIRSIDADRVLGSSHPSHDWLLSRLDREP